MILGDPALAEDAVQQAFTRLLARGRMTQVASLQAFLRIVVRNEAYRLLARRRPTQSIDDPPARLLESSGGAPERLDEQRELEQALRQLAPEQREVIHLKFYEDLTFAQIAEFLDISPNTAASRYRYALEHLRALLSAPRMET
jgi:RNA polymerase sigma-70 factor (ECF subfamily)